MIEEIADGKGAANGAEGEHVAFVHSLAKEIRGAGEQMTWELLGRLLDVLAEAVVVALIERWDFAVAESYKAVEGAFTRVLGFHGLPPRRDRECDGAGDAAGQLRA